MECRDDEQEQNADTMRHGELTSGTNKNSNFVVRFVYTVTLFFPDIDITYPRVNVFEMLKMRQMIEKMWCAWDLQGNQNVGKCKKHLTRPNQTAPD